MPVLENQTTALVSPEAISRAARTAVAGALEGDFSVDPIVGRRCRIPSASWRRSSSATAS